MSFDGSLALWLREQPGLLPLPKIVVFVRKAADTLQILHNQQIVHQDVNPEAFLLRSDNNNDEYELRLVDLEISVRVLSLYGKSSPANSQPLYMAPEQWMGQAVAATDQYALAVLTYQLLTGLAPFQGPPAQLMEAHFGAKPAAPGTFNQRVSPAIDAVILNALAKRPEDRFPTIFAFARALQEAVYHPEALIVSVPSTPVAGTLRATLHVSKAEAITGTLRTITLPEGRRVTVSVPAGAYDGQTIRLENPGSDASSDTVILTLAISSSDTNPLTVLTSQQTSQGLQITDAALVGLLKGPAVDAGPTVITPDKQQSGFTPFLINNDAGPTATPDKRPAGSTPLLVNNDAGVTVTPNKISANSLPLPTSEEPSKPTPPLSLPLITTLGRSRTIINNTSAFLATLSPVRRVFLFISILLIVVLIGAAIFSLTAANPNVSISYAPHSGTLVLNDALRDNSGGSNWPESVGTDGSLCQFMRGAYHVDVAQNGAFHYCLAGAIEYSNFAFEAHMTILKGDQGGLIFRADGDNSKFYYFRIGRDGSYGLYQYVDENGKQAQTLANGLTPAVHTGLNIDNLIAVAARGNILDLYVNNQLVSSVTNNTYSSGEIGFAAAYATDATEVAYSRIRVWTI